MLRRASQVSTTARGLSLGAAAPLVLHSIAFPRRSFFPPGTSGKDFLKNLTTPGEPAKAFSPLDTLRPPAPPSASDARPFGSLNRTNQLRRYVNVNVTSAKPANENSSTATKNTAAPAAAATAATGAPSNGAPSINSSVPPASSAAQPAPMDLSRLVRRHTSSTVSAGDATTAATAAHSSTASAHTKTHSTTQMYRDETSTHTKASAAQASVTEPASATVAKAQAAIAAAAAAAQQQQQQQMKAQASSTVSFSSFKTSNSKASHQNAEKKSAAAAAAAAAESSRQHSQVYKEHCNIGWSPEEFYRVVADVEHYTDFLPWCAGSEVHTTRRVRVPRGRRLLAGNLPKTSTTTAAATPAAGALNSNNGSSESVKSTAASAADAIAAAEAELVDAIEMTATLTIGFSFLKEQYTSRVTLYPGTKIVAALYDDEEADAAHAAASHLRDSHKSPAQHDSFVVSLFKKAASTAGAAAKRSILKHLLCEWEFCPVPGKPNTVEVVFSVSFEFKNPLHSHMIMSNVVTLMTRSFERRCESLYGPPSATKESLPLFF